MGFLAPASRFASRAVDMLDGPAPIRAFNGLTTTIRRWLYPGCSAQSIAPRFGLVMNQFHNRLKHISPEIVYSDGGFLAADHSIVDLLKDKAGKSARRRCRLCFHADEHAAQQEMLIVMHRSSYVRPHRHFGKLETMTLIEGACDALLFDEAGAVTQVIPMTPAAEGGSFFYRMPDRLFHTLIFRSEWIVFLETTIGPFSRDMTETPEWAPPETDAAAGHAYLSGLALPEPSSAHP